MGIHELLVATDEIKRMIQKRKPIEELRELAIREGMTTLLQDGILKVLRGHTDFKQVRAVCIR
jgi:type II secretory ATPase GspE/PulE/Tfp pilus assembly ATPase PilB-like protein